MKMDFKEEQSSEIEALESIYPNEFELIGTDPYIFRIFIKSENYEDGENGLCSLLQFELAENYPENSPIIQILSNTDNEEDPYEENYETNLTDTSITDLTQFLQKTAMDNLGMAMIFTLVSEAQEWLNKTYEKELKEREEEEERRAAEIEEAEQKRFEGTKVNVQNFMHWKLKFEAEMNDKRKVQLEKERELIGNKLTGRELFQRDTTLNESDLKFLEEGEVTIDESLFADVDDLVLEDEDDTEEDED